MPSVLLMLLGAPVLLLWLVLLVFLIQLLLLMLLLMLLKLLPKQFFLCFLLQLYFYQRFGFRHRPFWCFALLLP